MVPLYIVVSSIIILRGVGLLGVRRLSSWRRSGLYAMAIMFVFTGGTHFTGMRHDYAAMLPASVPGRLWLVYLTGALQIMGAIGLLIPRTRRTTGICLALLLVAMFPGNVYAALNNVPFRGEPATPLQLRTPIQLLLLGVILWTSIGEWPEERDWLSDRYLPDRRERVRRIEGSSWIDPL